MDIDELTEIIREKKPNTIRGYIFEGEEIKLYCKLCDEWLFCEQFSRDNSKLKVGAIFPYRSECKACQNEINKNSKRYLAKHTPTKRKEKK